MERESHVMAGLPGGFWTCTCGDIHASKDQRDVFIHLVWAHQQERNEARGLVHELREQLGEARELIEEWLAHVGIPGAQVGTIQASQDFLNRVIRSDKEEK